MEPKSKTLRVVLFPKQTRFARQPDSLFRSAAPLSLRLTGALSVIKSGGRLRLNASHADFRTLTRERLHLGYPDQALNVRFPPGPGVTAFTPLASSFFRMTGPETRQGEQRTSGIPIALV